MKSIGNKLQYVVESMAFDYVDYRVDILNPTATAVAYGRCYKTPEKTYGIIDVTEIIQNYCNFQEVFENEKYLNANTMALIYPVIKFNISTKAPNQQTYVSFITNEETLASYHNNIYNLIPTNNVLPNVLQHKREYYVNFNGRIPYDIIRKYGDSYFASTVYWRPDGNDVLLQAFTVSKSQLNHFMLPLLDTVNNYVEVWGVTRTNLGVETEIANSRIRYDYVKPYCSRDEYLVYWVNRYGGLECKCVDGRTIKKNTITPYNFNTYERNIVSGNSISKNKITFQNGTQQVSVTTQYECNFHYNLVDDTEWDYLETLNSSPMVWLYDTALLEFIPVVVKDNEFSYDYYRNNRKQLPSYKITFESSNIKIRR